MEAPQNEEVAHRKERIRAEVTAQRIALEARLRSEGEFELAAKLEKCGLPTTIVCVNCGHGHAVETRCKRRWCPTCSRAISAERVAKYQKKLASLQWPLWLTLTIRNDESETVLERIREGWKKFRRTKLFTTHTVGGLWAIEVTERGNGWHPHIHAMLDCKWLAYQTPAPVPEDKPHHVHEKIEFAKAELATVWGNCVDQKTAIALAVRKNGATAARELLKYAVKGSDLLESVLPVGRMIAEIDAGRTISTFGTLRKKKGEGEELEELEADEEKPGLECTSCGEAHGWLPEVVVKKFTGKFTPRTVYFGAGDHELKHGNDGGGKRGAEEDPQWIRKK